MFIETKISGKRALFLSRYLLTYPNTPVIVLMNICMLRYSTTISTEILNCKVEAEVNIQKQTKQAAI